MPEDGSNEFLSRVLEICVNTGTVQNVLAGRDLQVLKKFLGN